MSTLRTTVGTVIAGGAQALSVASKLLDATARALRPDSDGATLTNAPDEPLPRPTQPVAERGRVIEPDPTPMLDETPHVRTSASHIEDIAAKPVGQVVAAVADLSTDELRLLTEHELAHKNRRTVLTAIEKALAPTPV